MNTDFYCEIGESHVACEDYALAGKINDNISYAIVADGCSSSPNVDVGARVLAHAALDYLTSQFAKSPEIDIKWYSDSPDRFNEFNANLRRHIISMASSVLRMLRLDPGAMDATLLIAISDGKTTHVMMYGDGGYIIKYKSGMMYYHYIEFTGGAPYYLSYQMDRQRESNYHTAYDGKDIRCGNIVIPSIGAVTSRFDTFSTAGEWLYAQVTNHPEGISFIALASDGIRSYRRRLEGGAVQDIDVTDMVRKYADFKNFSGHFVQRRMQSIKADCRSDSTTHYDDISSAVIHIP